MSLAVAPGEMVTLMGRNGMGKTTTVRSIMGLTPALTGSIRFDGREIRDLAAYQVAKLGIGLVPEGRQVFPNLTARENLVATGAIRRRAAETWTVEKVCTLFPRLAERIANMANQLSGGDQQMLAIGRALMTNPRLLILDEATEGLAPLIRAEIWQCLTKLKAAGQSILVIDKNVQALIRIAERHYLIERGKVVWTGSSRELAAAPASSDTGGGQPGFGGGGCGVHEGLAGRARQDRPLRGPFRALRRRHCARCRARRDERGADRLWARASRRHGCCGGRNGRRG